MVGVVVPLITVIACRSEWRTVTAISPIAYQTDDAAAEFLVGKGASPGRGNLPELNAVPSKRYFDARGYSPVGAGGARFWDDDTQRQAAAQLSGSYMQVCSGNAAALRNASRVADAVIEVIEVFSVDDIERRYEGLLTSCCNNYDSDCDNWIVTRAFKTKVSWTVETSSALSGSLDVQCNAPSVGPEELQATLKVSADSSNTRKATLSSEGWNVVEIVPLEKVCKEWKRSCKVVHDEDVRRRQLLCDRLPP